MLAQRAVDGLADRQAGVERHERLAGQIGRHHDAPAGEPVVRVAYQGHGLLAQRHDAQRPVGRRIGHDTDVGLAAQHRLHDLVRMQALELDQGFGVLRPELLHGPAHVVQPHRVDGRHPDRAGDARLDGTDLGLGLLPGVQDPPGRLVERPPLPGDDERTLGPIDQGHAQLRLELLNGLAGGRLGDEVLVGAPREGAQPDDVAVEAQGLQVHGPSLHH